MVAAWWGCAGHSEGHSAEGDRQCFGRGDSKRPINFSVTSGMTNECFSKGAKGEISRVWLCGPRAGFSTAAFAPPCGWVALGGGLLQTWGVLLIMITPKVTSVTMGSRKAK